MDILTISDLLNEFCFAEADILNKHDIKHPTTIGSMYEGLTAEVLKLSIFEGLNLSVVKNSFIVGSETEFDVLLVEGKGEQIPYTHSHKFKPEQVIAVVQVKKNLYSKDINEGYNNLKFLIDHYEIKDGNNWANDLFRDSFRNICRKDISSYAAGTLSENEELLFHTLKVEAFLPVRVIWGYNGFASEYNFRKSFEDYLAENITTDITNSKRGFGPHNFPSLIICGSFAMFKNNAMPFIAHQERDGWWPFYATSSFNPTYFFLELIWSRLFYRFKQIPHSIFGEDLRLEPANRFLDGRIQKLDEQVGWEYKPYPIKNKELKTNKQFAEWSPIELDFTQYRVIARLCVENEIDLSVAAKLEREVIRDGYLSLAEFLEKLEITGLVYIENQKLKLLTDQCQPVILPNGKLVAGENKSGRVTNWIMKNFPKSVE